jgi:multiple sugar transport system permease protein
MSGQTTRVRPSPAGRASSSRLDRLTLGASIDRPSPAARFFSHAFLILAVVVFVAPFFYIVSASFKDSSQLFQYPPQWIPDPPFLGQYERLLFNSGFPRWMFNTLFVATVVTCVKLFLDSLAGYAFAKLSFAGRNWVFAVMIGMLLVPYGAIILSLYSVARTLGITNSYWGLILPPLANPFGIFLMRQFIAGLPRDLENAARLDGVSEFGIYRRIILPLIKPGLVVLAVITFTDSYMSFIWPLVSTRSQDLQVLTVGLSTMRNMTQVNFGLWSAGAVLGMLPLAVFFFLLQKQFQARSIAGALKQ